MRKMIYIAAVAVVLGMTLLVWNCKKNSPQTVSAESMVPSTTASTAQAVPEAVPLDTTPVRSENNHIVTGHAVSMVMPAMPTAKNSPQVISEAEIRQRIEAARDQSKTN